MGPAAILHCAYRRHLMTLADEFAYAVSNPCDLAARFRIRQFRARRSFSVAAVSTVPLVMTTP